MIDNTLNSSLFENSQTFVGVLITLIVLCLFNDKSNFLLNMLSKLNEDMDAYLNNCLETLKKTMIFEWPKNGAYSYDFWKEELDAPTKQKLMDIENKSQNDIYEFHNRSQIFINDYKNSIKQITRKHELTFIEIHLFIITLILMAVDGCCSIGVGWNCFVYILIFFSLGFSFFLWYHCIRNTENRMTEEPPEILAEREFRKITIKIVLNIIYRIIYFSACISVLCFTSEIWTIVYLMCVMLLTFFVFYKHCCRKLVGLNHYKYANSLIIKHTIYQLLIAFIVATIVKIFTFYDCICVWAKDNKYETVQKLAGQWEENITIVFNSLPIGHIFMLYLLAACFIVPLLWGYIMNFSYSRKVLLSIQQENEIVSNKFKDYENQYHAMINNFIEERTHRIHLQSDK